jgi:hypothetical protein
VRKSGVILVVALLFLPFGVPRWIAGDGASAGSDAAATFGKLCRDHGGTPRRPPGSVTRAQPQRACTVRYGGHVYVMDAITPDGFDEDTARYQRQGCDEARRAQRASPARWHRRQSFIYHPTTGVCERDG